MICGLIADYAGQDDPNKPALGIFRCCDSDAIPPKPEKLIDDDDKKFLHLVRIRFLGAWNNAEK
jgi:hypothetical protein